MISIQTRINILLSLFGGLLAAFSFPNPFYQHMNWPLGWLSWICLVPLFFIKSKNESFKELFGLGFLFGMFYFGISVFWIAGMKSMHPLGPLAWLLLSAYLACYPGFFLYLYHKLKTSSSWWGAAIALWILLEYCRNFMLSGFPWASLGYAHYGNPAMMALLPVVGIWGLSLLTVAGNCVVAKIIENAVCKIIKSNQDRQLVSKRFWGSFILYSVVGCIIVIGSYLEIKRPLHESSSLVVGALQGNINQNQAWDKNYRESTLRRFNSLIVEAVHLEAKLVIWPETAFPGIYNYDQGLAEQVKRWSSQYNINQLVGADEIEASNKDYLYYNALIHIDEKGQTQKKTAKKHLVPFGEYVPYKDSFFFFIHKVVQRYGGAGFTPGKKRTLFEINGNDGMFRTGGIICFESLFPKYTRELVEKGAALLTVVTYDTWFGESAAPACHAIFSAFRAAETGRYLVRVGANGISCFFNEKGKLLSALELNKSGLLAESVKLLNHQTFYVKFGDWIFNLCIIFFVIELWWWNRKKLVVILKKKLNRKY